MKLRIPTLGAVFAVLLFLGMASGILAANRAPQSYGMKKDLNAHAIAEARRITIHWRDLFVHGSPDGWFTDGQWKPGLVNKTGPPLIQCQGRYADLSGFTFRGGWSTRFFRYAKPSLWDLISSAVVVATRAEAAHYFDTLDTWSSRCFKKGMTVGKERYISVLRIRRRSHAGQEVEFRIRATSINEPAKKVGSVFVYLQLGNVLMEASFEWSYTPVPSTVIETVIHKMATRKG